MRMVLILLLILFSSPAWATNWCDDSSAELCWTMDIDESPISDLSVNSNTGALSGSTTPSFVSSCSDIKKTVSTDGCYTFNGTTAYIAASDDATLDADVASNGTFVVWANSDNWGGNPFLVSKQTGSSDTTAAYRVEHSSDKMYITQDGSSTDQNFRTHSSPTNGTWYHVAITWDGTNQCVYIDGASTCSSATSTPYQNNSADYELGAATNKISTREFDGELDENALFSSTLNSTDINDIMDNGLSQPASSSAPAGINLFGNVQIF